MIVLVLALVVVPFIAIITVRTRRNQKPSPPPGPSEGALLPQNNSSGGHQSKLQPAPPPQQPRYVAHPPVGDGSVVQYPGSMVHLPPPSAVSAPGHQTGQPIVVYQDPSSAASVYIAQRPPPQSTGPVTANGRPEYQYQHLDVI